MVAWPCDTGLDWTARDTWAKDMGGEMLRLIMIDTYWMIPPRMTGDK